MKDSFAEIVEEVKNLSTEEKLELQTLIEKYLVEERRQEIYANQQESLRELKEGELVFSGETDYFRGSMRS
jgi:phosphopantothenate synthetase